MPVRIAGGGGIGNHGARSGRINHGHAEVRLLGNRRRLRIGDLNEETGRSIHGGRSADRSVRGQAQSRRQNISVQKRPCERAHASGAGARIRESGGDVGERQRAQRQRLRSQGQRRVHRERQGTRGRATGHGGHDLRCADGDATGEAAAIDRGDAWDTGGPGEGHPTDDVAAGVFCRRGKLQRIADRHERRIRTNGDARDIRRTAAASAATPMTSKAGNQ